VAKGALNKVSKGKYFKPRRSMFGILNPSVSEITKDFLEKNGKVIGYITGPAAFASMGLTSQITTSILVGSNKYRRPVTRGNSTISFFLQLNPINEENIPLLRILDASKLINVIPGTTIDENVDRIGNIISKLSKEEQERLCILAEQYPPRVRSLLGAILENINASTYSLMDTLNGVTTYKLPVSYRVLPTKRNWNII
jgi:hypothetical protein